VKDTEENGKREEKAEGTEFRKKRRNITFLPIG
jgi:hypothetical protein